MIRNSDREPRGLTTAASLFFAATVGIAVGIEEFGIGIGMTALALLTLAGLPADANVHARRVTLPNSTCK